MVSTRARRSVRSGVARRSRARRACARRRRVRDSPRERAHRLAARVRAALGRLRARHAVAARQSRAAGLAAALRRLHADRRAPAGRASSELITERARRRLHHVDRLADRDRREAQRACSGSARCRCSSAPTTRRAPASASAAATSCRTTSTSAARRCSRTRWALGATRDTSLAYQQGRITALEGRALGVHIAFAPVLDVNNNPANPVIGVRSFGEDPHLVADMGAALIHGIQEHGMIATGKHFPGHGDTDENSHLDGHDRAREPRAHRQRRARAVPARDRARACRGS